jgi:hypothetical protein
MEPTVRTCIKCGKEKPFGLFTKRTGGPNNRLNICKRCTADYCVARYKANVPTYERAKARIKADHTRNIQSVLDHYGRVCACCGEAEITFLTVDHIEELRSKKSRVEMGHHTIYEFLVRNHFPPGFRILCYNCNCGGPHNGGICPHQEGSQARAQARSRKCGEVPDSLLQGEDMVEAPAKARAVSVA